MALLRLHPVHATEPQVKPPKFLLAWGKKGTKEGELLFPIGIAVNRLMSAPIKRLTLAVRLFVTSCMVLFMFFT